MGEYEPEDSRNVTGAGQGAPQQQGVRSPGGAEQQQGRDRWSGDGTQMQQSQGGSEQMSQGQTRGESGDGPQNQGMQGEIGANSGTEGQQVQFEPDPSLNREVGSQSGSTTGGGWGSGQMDAGSAGDPQAQQRGGASGPGAHVREHMDVIGADGVHLGTVDHVEGDRIKLTRKDSGMGAHEGHHHYIPLGLVAGVEGDRVRLSATAAVAYGMEQEEGE